MKIDVKKIKKYAGNTILAVALAGALALTVNEYTVNHNDNICLLTRIIGYEHQVSKINNDPDNIKNGVFAVYSPNLYEVPDGYFIDYDEKIAYKPVKEHIAYDVNDNNRAYTVPDTMVTTTPTYRPLPNIEIVKTDEITNKRTIIKTLKLK